MCNITFFVYDVPIQRFRGDGGMLEENKVFKFRKLRAQKSLVS